MADIGIVILNYRNAPLTRKCVDALLALGLDAEIVVVDNDSGGGEKDTLSAAYRQTPGVEVIGSSRNGGYAAGNNLGIGHFFSRHPQAKYVCIMNPDVEIPQGEIFASLVRLMERSGDIAAATGVMHYPDGTVSPYCCWQIPGKWEAALGHCVLWRQPRARLTPDADGVCRVDAVPGSFFMLRRSAWERLGGLDEGTFLYNEENILAIRLRQLGMTEAIDVNHSFVHNHPRGRRQSLGQKLRSRSTGNQSRRYLCRSYYGVLPALLLEAVILLNYAIIILMHLAGNIRRWIRGEAT